MALQKIDINTPQPNGKFGESTRSANIKHNSNITEVGERLEALEEGTGGAGQAIEELRAELQQETQERQQAVQQESAARSLAVEAMQQADDALGERIDAEQIARQQQAEALGFRILGKNRLINGDFRFWQRGTTSAAAAARRYVADRWEVWSIGSTTQVDAMAINDGSIDPPVRYAQRVIVNSVPGAGSMALLRQHIEDVRTDSGKTVTFAVRLYSQAASQVAVNLSQNFGSGGSAAVNVLAQKVALVAGWQTLQLTFEVPSVAGKTIGTSSSLILQMWMDAGANYNDVTNTLGQRSGTYWFANAQLELGSMATAFEHVPEPVALANCQRYYEKSYDISTTPGTSVREGCVRTGLTGGFFMAMGSVSFKVTKRIGPAVITYAARNGAVGQLSEVNSTGNYVANRSCNPSYIGQQNFNVGGDAYTAGSNGEYHWTADAEL